MFIPKRKKRRGKSGRRANPCRASFHFTINDSMIESNRLKKRNGGSSSSGLRCISSAQKLHDGPRRRTPFRAKKVTGGPPCVAGGRSAVSPGGRTLELLLTPAREAEALRRRGRHGRRVLACRRIPCRQTASQPSPFGWDSGPCKWHSSRGHAPASAT